MKPGSGTREGSPQKLGEETKWGARIKAEPTQRLKAGVWWEGGGITSRSRRPASSQPFAGGGWGSRAPTRRTHLIGFFPKARSGRRKDTGMSKTHNAPHVQ